MYARIARFEGGDPESVEQQIAETRSQIEAARAGLPEDAPEAARTLSETIARFVELVDREQGTLVGIAFCESEEDMRRADEALNSLSPGEGGGQRTSVQIFEVAIDTNLALTT